MEIADATGPVIETKGVVLSDVAGESTPKSKRESSPVPPLRPHLHRGRGFAPVFEDVVEVYTPGGERMEFDTKDIKGTSELVSILKESDREINRPTDYMNHPFCTILHSPSDLIYTISVAQTISFSITCVFL